MGWGINNPTQYLINTAASSICTNTFATAQILSEFNMPRFEPDYVLNKFGVELESDAKKIIRIKNRLPVHRFRFEEKINELIRSDDSHVFSAYRAKFISNSPYYYNSSTQTYQSGHACVRDILHNSIILYGFPNLPRRMSEDLGFCSVVSKLVKTHAPVTIQMHQMLDASHPGYIIHSVAKAHIEVMAKESYAIYCAVQQFLQTLTREQINWIELVKACWSNYSREEYCANPCAFNSYCVSKYKDAYGCEPPAIKIE